MISPYAPGRVSIRILTADDGTLLGVVKPDGSVQYLGPTRVRPRLRDRLRFLLGARSVAVPLSSASLRSDVE